MKKLLSGFLLLLFPIFSFAESALSFAPPTTDVSVIFLGNIFGMVDGVLSGTGSQMMGNIFGVFNAAVLALGGIVIIYTLLVSTINTANEGEMLGKKWSSVWVPVRATLGLALLIPKASGYCLMQIFVMWVVVQGVGAADKVWNAALNYLNRGGVIIQQQINPIGDFKGGGSSIVGGAANILYGQVCMLGLQRVLAYVREGYVNSKEEGAEPCAHPIREDMRAFCNTPVPDFISSVNAVAFQNKHATPLVITPGETKKEIKGAIAEQLLTLPMPNFDSPPYSVLNGICGTITWYPVETPRAGNINNPNMNQADLKTVQFSRAIGIQQMYSILATVAHMMVNNDPQLTNPNASTTNYAYPTSPFAIDQYGLPYTITGTVCPDNQTFGTSTANCVSWGPDKTSDTAPLFSGTELLNSVAAYNAIMLPTITLLRELRNTSTREAAAQQRAFLISASSQGWMLAGSYFFQLSGLNALNTSTTTSTSGDTTSTEQTIDVASGLENSDAPKDLTAAFGDNDCQPHASSRGAETLCRWLRNDKTKLYLILSLMNGSTNGSTAMVNPPDIPSSSISPTLTLSPEVGAGSSTVYGYVNNALMVIPVGQVGMAPPEFTMNIKPAFPAIKEPNFPNLLGNTSCEAASFWQQSYCLVQSFVLAFFNDIFLPLFKFFFEMVSGIINTIIMAFLFLPLVGIAEIFKYCLKFVEQPDVNPIVALANMGVQYINFASDLWIFLTGLAVATFFLGPFGLVIMIIVGMALPLLLAWFGIMILIGFTTAYFIPFFPYMIFTFGSIAWLMAVIEAMVAAPIVALGITHPEGEGPFGKGEHAVLLLTNVFLRPALMIIGYISGIMLSYVSVWVINAGFSNVLEFLQGPSTGKVIQTGFSTTQNPTDQNQGVGEGYASWAGIYAYFFSILIYTTMYMTVVQKSFTMIVMLPDKVLRWIGGQAENIGQEVTQWTEDSKSKVGEAGKETNKAQGQMDQKFGGYAQKLVQKATPESGSGPDVGAS